MPGSPRRGLVQRLEQPVGQDHVGAHAVDLTERVFHRAVAAHVKPRVPPISAPRPSRTSRLVFDDDDPKALGRVNHADIPP